jgi:hypothetical protein
VTRHGAAASSRILTCVGVLIDLDLDSSPLLRASIDERFFRLWDFARTGEFPGHRPHKEEFETRVATILDTTGENELRDLARRDRSLCQGSTFRGPENFDPDTGDLRVIAIRELELAIYAAECGLYDASFLPASPDDRACMTVPGLFPQLRGRHRLLKLTPAMVKDRLGWHDRVVCFGEHGIFPHPALRPARELVQDLCDLAVAGGDVQIAVDPHAVVPRAEISGAGLYDYWFGMKLDLARLDDPRATGHTVHGRRPENQSRFTFPLLRTEFSWSVDGPLKTLQVQETVPGELIWPDHGGKLRRSHYVVNRYLHSIRDTQRRSFVHLDGAAKAFPRGRYGPTVEQPKLPQGEPVYRKLFRVDGDIHDDAWALMVAHFFRENELVIEYFGEMLDDRPSWRSAAA